MTAVYIFYIFIAAGGGGASKYYYSKSKGVNGYPGQTTTHGTGPVLRLNPPTLGDRDGEPQTPKMLEGHGSYGHGAIQVSGIAGPPGAEGRNGYRSVFIYL